MNKISLDDVEEYLEQPHHYSNYIACICPFHNDTSPSMMVYNDGYHCKACGAHGTLEYLWAKVSGRPVVKIKPKFNRSNTLWSNWLNRWDDVETICKIAHDYTVSNPSKYLRDRKIGDVVKSLQIGYLDGFFVFPVKDRTNKIIGATARASPSIQTKETRWSISPDCHALFVPNWKQVLSADVLFVVFGIFDAIGLSMCGFPAVTGVTGASFDPLLLDEFSRPIYIIPDKHEERQGLDLVSKLGWRGIALFLDYPEGMKDTADVREKADDQTLIRLVNEKIEATKIHL